PDNHYLHASLDGRLTYKISGRRGTVHYLGFGTQIGHYGQGRGMPPTGYVEASELQIDETGEFELIISAQDPRAAEPDANWLPMTEETGTLIVRQTFLDRTKENPAELEIEVIDEAPPREFLSAEKLDDGLKQASTLVAGASLLFAKWANDWKKHANELPLFDVEKSNQAGGDPNIRYYHSYWALKPDEALVIRARIPRCEHWNFQLNNYWLESLDYRYHRIHINKADAQLDDDSHVTIIVAHRDPGHPNWIETTGHQEGTMSFRWVSAEEHPAPEPQVVPWNQLSEYVN
ncbi:MAG: DUF1214 domain-containing protein, partial [Polyangiaceae bacterium]|nr:DUF1214 domain-containing protein [Polyangiaceae bacterium]